MDNLGFWKVLGHVVIFIAAINIGFGLLNVHSSFAVAIGIALIAFGVWYVITQVKRFLSKYTEE